MGSRSPWAGTRLKPNMKENDDDRTAPPEPAADQDRPWERSGITSAGSSTGPASRYADGSTAQDVLVVVADWLYADTDRTLAEYLSARIPPRRRPA